jgi:putative DNA primase/helicase
MMLQSEKPQSGKSGAFVRNLNGLDEAVEMEKDYLTSALTSSRGGISDAPEAFWNELEANGLHPAEIVADGCLHRCPIEGKPNGRDGAYVLHPDLPISGWWQNFVTGGSGTWTAKQENRHTPEERRTLAARAKTDQAARKHAQAQRHAEAAKRAATIYAEAQECTGHQYLTLKGVNPCPGLKVAGDGKLVIPTHGPDGAIATLQFIDGDGSKFFLSGGKKKNACFLIPAKEKNINKIAYIGEGIATALSVREATGAACYVAFDAGNLLPVAQRVRDELGAEWSIVLAADNDVGGERNVGLEAARKAAAAIGGKVALPISSHGGKCDFNDLHAAQGIEEVRRQIENTQALGASTWDDVIPLGAGPLPALEPEMFPGIWPMAQAIAEAIQVPLELSASAVLGGVSAACCGRFEVEVCPGYVEPVQLYQACLLGPGNRKSPVVKEVKSPLVEWETEQRQALRDSVQRVRSERKTLERAIDKRRTRAANLTDPEEMRREVQDIAELEADLPEAPTLPRLFIDDATPEAIVTTMAGQGERLSIFEAEGGLFDILGGRYSSGRANLDAVLKMWSRESVTVDRVGRDPIRLESPSLSVLLTPQPELLRVLRGNSAFEGRGFVARFLFWMPASPVGQREGRGRPIPQDVRDEYRAMIRRLLETFDPAPGHGRYHRLRLSHEAAEIYQAFWEKVEAAHGPGGELEEIVAWTSKAPGQAVRVAGLLHCAREDGPQESPIPAETMEAAVHFVSVAVEHYRAVMAHMEADDTTALAEKILTKLRAAKSPWTTARDILRSVATRKITRKADIAPAISLLTERGYIRRAAGRGERYEVNPDVWGASNV